MSITQSMYRGECPRCDWTSPFDTADPLKALRWVDEHTARVHPKPKPETLSVTAQAIRAAELGYLPGEDGPLAEWLAEYAEHPNVWTGPDFGNEAVIPHTLDDLRAD